MATEGFFSRGTWHRLDQRGEMRIIDLTEEYEPTFLACLKDWHEDAVGKCHKARWCDMMKCKGLRVKLALDDSERAVGMIAACSSFISDSGRRYIYAG